MGDSGRRSQLLALAAGVLVVTGGVLALRGSTPQSDDARPSTTTTSTPTTSAPITSTPDTVTTLILEEAPAAQLIAGPPIEPPFEGRAGAAVGWTGTELLVWGGAPDEVPSAVFSDGWAYDPTGEAWRQLPDSPLVAVTEPASVWSEDEFIIFTGTVGASYDPASDTWNELATMPGLAVGPEVDPVWTGETVVRWFWSANELHSLDLSSGQWQELAPLPIDSSALVQMAAMHWTGRELIALAVVSNPSFVTSEMRTFAYRDEAWVELETLDMGDPYPTNSAVEEGNLYVWGRGGAEDPAYVLPFASTSWLPIPGPPIASCEGHPDPVVIGRELNGGQQILVSDPCGGGGAVHESATRAWRALESTEGWFWSDAVWADDRVLIMLTCCFGTGSAPMENHIVALRWE